MKGFIVSLVGATLVLVASVDAFGQEDDALVRWGKDVSDTERNRLEIAGEASWRAVIDALTAASMANLPGPELVRRWAESSRMSAFGSRLRDLYGTSRELLYYRHAPASAVWAVTEARKASEELEKRLDRVSDFIVDLEAQTAPLPEDLARLPLFSRLTLLSRMLEALRPKLNRIVQSKDIVDVALLREVNSEFRAIREIIRILSASPLPQN